jgi:DNA polymerase-3 subunit epsilon
VILSSVSLPESLAIIDVETTGANPAVDRITEIAIIRIERGEVVERWEQLVNPGIPIPAMIQRFTGITDAMVAAAPPFAAVAERTAALCAGCVFVAHNARFDYGFIKQEFQRLEQEFEAPVLCTVKLSRALFPMHHRHGLDALIERHDLACSARHRAMGDAEALWSFVRLAQEQFTPEQLAPAAARAMKQPPRPPDLPAGAIEGVPDAPGVYLFFGEQLRPLYIGRSASLRARVMDHCASAREADLIRQVRRVEWIQTAGELSAQLLEADLLRSRQPLKHKPPQAGAEPFALRLRAHRRRPPIFERVPVAGTDPAAWAGLHGLFRSAREADGRLRELAQVYRLCPRRLGFEAGGSGACSAYPTKRCAGVCAGRERIEEHDARFAGALHGVGLKPWPWAGPVVVSEHHQASGRRAFVVLDRWCLLATAASEGELDAALAALPHPAFDIDTYRILCHWFDAPARRAGAVPIAG